MCVTYLVLPDVLQGTIALEATKTEGKKKVLGVGNADMHVLREVRRVYKVREHVYTRTYI